MTPSAAVTASRRGRGLVQDRVALTSCDDAFNGTRYGLELDGVAVDTCFLTLKEAVSSSHPIDSIRDHHPMFYGHWQGLGWWLRYEDGT